MTRTAEDVFYEYADRFDWEFSAMADVLVAYLGEAILDNLLSFIQGVGLTEDFEEFLADNFQGERAGPPDDRDLVAQGEENDEEVNELVQMLLERPGHPAAGGVPDWPSEGF
jgi:hypothetical protein